MSSRHDLIHLHHFDALVRERDHSVWWSVDGLHLMLIIRRPTLKTIIVTDAFDPWEPLFRSATLCMVLDRMALHALYELDPSTALKYRSACR